MYPYLFEIGPISIGTFGLMVALGFLAALYVLNREFKRQGPAQRSGIDDCHHLHDRRASRGQALLRAI